MTSVYKKGVFPFVCASRANWSCSSTTSSKRTVSILIPQRLAMTLISRFWHAVVEVAAWLTLSPVPDWRSHSSQIPLHRDRPNSHQGGYQSSPGYDDNPLPLPPIFKPPTTSPTDDHDFQCNYTAMEGWFPCSISEDRECWLRNRDGGEFNIHTNYEKFAPVGITRHYTLVVTEDSWNADGQDFPNAKLFNNSYPGPWLEACWGDVRCTPRG